MRIHNQAISLLGLSCYSSKPEFTVGFIKLFSQGSHMANAQQDTTKPITSWVYQAAKELERLTAKLVSSTTELWTPTPGLASLLKHLHTQHQEASPSLLHVPSGYAFPFQCFSGCAKKKTITLDLSMRFLLTLGLSS